MDGPLLTDFAHQDRYQDRYWVPQQAKPAGYPFDHDDQVSEIDHTSSLLGTLITDA